MIDWSRKIFGVHSPSRRGMTHEQIVEIGKAFKEGFDEGFKGTRQKADVFAETIRGNLIPPMKK